MNRHEMEAELRGLLGVEKITWLPYGHAVGMTDGHMEEVCMFARPGRAPLSSTRS
ncbi:agmatine deiminase family protein [Nonomuraea mangrovi]|uniref:Agmatine deiminase family protein n=1 Tax=Nonomuraea mangrovi TaxID=2316207 RepID=A0ABW4SK15_9ACTN